MSRQDQQYPETGARLRIDAYTLVILLIFIGMMVEIGSDVFAGQSVVTTVQQVGAAYTGGR